MMFVASVGPFSNLLIIPLRDHEYNTCGKQNDEVLLQIGKIRFEFRYNQNIVSPMLHY